jgi:hypothetical protein
LAIFTTENYRIVVGIATGLPRIVNGWRGFRRRLADLRFVARWHGTRTMVSPNMLRCAALALLFAVGCHGPKTPEARVLGSSPDLVYVQVTNPASHTMRITHLDYTFAADGATLSKGELDLQREVPAGQTAVVEVPLDDDSLKPVTLTGTVTAEVDEIVRSFSVSAQIQPH